MKPEIAEFDVFPRVVRAGRMAQITIRPLYDHTLSALAQATTARLAMFPAGGRPGETSSPGSIELAGQWSEGTCHFQYFFEQEQEYILVLEVASAMGRARTYEFRFYALRDDLMARKPYKGDLHIHSYRSDGIESPAYVAAACRRIGMDFMAVTDHRQYAPSLEAANAFQGLPVDLRIYPGEEVHPPDNPVHMINFGASFSLNELFRQEEGRYRAEVQAIADHLADFPAGVDHYTYASCAWCFDQIRAGGGLGILCHPYWLTRHRFDVSETLVNLLLERQPYDALEVIGGYHLHEAESNLLQVARYHEERANGRHIPIVGVSDAHGCERGELFGWYFTIAFSPSLDLPDLVRSVNDLYSVAVDALPGEVARAHGPFRLVSYAHFLLREIFPLHDALCLEEGRQMLAHLAGDAQAATQLAVLQGRTRELYHHLWM
jgi:hypothetical protein